MSTTNSHSCKLIHGDCLKLIKSIPDNSIDCILTDPPYLYLKHKLDKMFDEDSLFQEWDRVVKNDGFIVFFGRGESFYRWNVKLNNLGWHFKEEVIWKKASSSPLTPIIRVHETISILSKKGKINKIRTEHANVTPPEVMLQEIKRLLPAMKETSKDFESLSSYCRDYIIKYDKNRNSQFNITSNLKSETSRPVGIAQGIIEGKREQDVMVVKRDSYKKIKHPTQKPYKLIERLLKLVTQDGDIVLDCFMGSGSTGVACIKTNRNFIGMEIDKEYFNIAEQRINSERKNLNVYN